MVILFLVWPFFWIAMLTEPAPQVGLASVTLNVNFTDGPGVGGGVADRLADRLADVDVDVADVLGLRCCAAQSADQYATTVRARGSVMSNGPA